MLVLVKYNDDCYIKIKDFPIVVLVHTRNYLIFQFFLYDIHRKIDKGFFLDLEVNSL